jgi:hypothetical protein
MLFSPAVDRAVDRPTLRSAQAVSRARVVVVVLALLAMVTLGESFGYYRSVTGVLMFLGILVFGVRYVRTMGDIPPEPEITDISEYGLKYVCGNCGLELKVEKAARDKAPTHCMEPMNLVREGGKPPLRPV